MPLYGPELIRLMRTVLEDVMLQVPPSISNTATKALLAETILKAAAQGQTSYSELYATAIQTIVSMIS